MTNEKLIKELQKFNTDLEKHMPSMNMDLLRNSDIFAEGEPTEEMLALLINEVNDLKTEVALTRKNLADNVEGMIMRVLNNERNAMMKQVNDFNSKMVANLRDSLGSYITQVNGELSTIRKEFNQVKIASENLTEMFTSSKESLSDVAMSMDEFKGIREEFKLGLQKLNERIDKADNNVKKIKSEMPHFDVKKELTRIKSDVLENKKEIMHIENIESDEPKLRSINEISIDDDINVEEQIADLGNHDYLRKIITIDERIKKLDALK